MDLQSIITSDAQHYMNTFGARTPVCFERGQGCTLYDSNGRAYTDFLAGIAVNCLGYAHPRLSAALHAQVDALLHVSNYFYNLPQVRLAETLTAHSCAFRVFIANSGTEANEGAVKLARRYFKRRGEDRYTVLSLDNSFHGRTLAMAAATGQPKYQQPYTPLPAGFINVPAGDVPALQRAADEHTAAVLIELVQGEGGVMVLPQRYVQQIAQFCQANGLLLIVDEVQTGVGRTGTLFAYEQYGIEPDIFTLAKGLGGGVPIGALCAKEYAAAFEPGDHGTTFGGNPLACAAANAVLDILFQDDLLSHCRQTGAYFADRLHELRRKHTCVSDVRGMGLLLGMQLDDQVSGKQIVARALEKGFVINCAGANTLRFVPPLIISTQQIDSLCATLDQLLEDAHYEPANL